VFQDARLTQSTLVIRRAVALLDDTFDALLKPERWCDDAWARDAAGATIYGSVIEAIESPHTASRCLLGELTHQGLRRGYRIEFLGRSQQPTELRCAPASFWLAAEALAEVAAEVLAENELPIRGVLPDFRLDASLPHGRRVLIPIELNEECSYEPVISTVVLAAEGLRAELDRRGDEASA
jgi:hypothetical protein